MAQGQFLAGIAKGYAMDDDTRGLEHRRFATAVAAQLARAGSRLRAAARDIEITVEAARILANPGAKRHR